ncbi:hypothetical protein DFH09DRAFT_1312691 [Mycena vulgaris]|nr:hypothetical protein DFH09DRAFT_1312691 [Mycena vulgaris]
MHFTFLSRSFDRTLCSVAAPLCTDPPSAQSYSVVEHASSSSHRGPSFSPVTSRRRQSSATRFAVVPRAPRPLVPTLFSPRRPSPPTSCAGVVIMTAHTHPVIAHGLRSPA